MRLLFSRRRARNTIDKVDFVVMSHPDRDYFYGGGMAEFADKVVLSDELKIQVLQTPHQGTDVSRAKRGIIRPPNPWMRGVAEFLFAKKTFQGVFEPLMADQAYEWSEAVIEGREGKARWISIKYAVWFGLHSLAQGLSALKILVETWRLM